LVKLLKSLKQNLLSTSQHELNTLQNLVTTTALSRIIINMARATEPSALLSHLHRADGSATFSQNGYTAIGAVNGPIEVQRRDELPEEAAVDVVVRPAAGVGGKFLNIVSIILSSFMLLPVLTLLF
jgi:hypothetical protein